MARRDSNESPFARSRAQAASGLGIRGPEGRRTVSVDAVPTSPQFDVFDRRRTTMIEAEDGEVLTVRVSAPATEMLTLGSERIACRRFRVSGGMDATLWYAPSEILVRKRLTAPDGSTIMTALQ